MIQVWIFFLGIITTSDSFLLTGITAKIKTYAEHFPWFINDGNSYFRDKIISSTKFDINTEKPTSLKEYLQELPTDHIDNHSSRIWTDSKVVVVARIGDYDDETRGEWVIVAEPKEINKTFNDNGKNGSENSTESSDYFLGNDDLQKYLNDYQDLLYTFKDFVKIGANPSIRKNISQYNSSNENNEKVFNVTYVMPIPKTKKYFEIKLSNLTKSQYNEINELLQKLILRKTNSTESTKKKEQDIVHVDENANSNSLKIHAFVDPLSLHNQTSRTMHQNSRFTKDLLRENESLPDYFGPLLTPEGFNYFLNNFDSIHINLNNKTVDQTIFQPSDSPSTFMQNNGFRAEIATDYVKKHDVNGESNAEVNSFSQTNKDSKDLSDLNYERVASGRTILNPNIKRNRTKLFSQSRSKRPIMNAPENVLNTKKQKIFATNISLSERPITPDFSILPQNSSNNTIKSNFKHINISSNPIIDKSIEIKNINSSQNIENNKDNFIQENNTTASISAKDWLEVYKLYNITKPNTPSLFSDTSFNETNGQFRKAGDQIPSLNVMEAAEWLINIKRKMDEEERKKTERHKSYIKQLLGHDEGSILLGRGNSGNIMKINKQENILEELKFLMLDYFSSLNFKTQEAINNNSSAVQLILNTTNLFELMEQSSQLVKSNLHLKLQSKTQEPTKFLNQIAEKQVEKCKKIFDKGLLLRPSGSSKKSGHRRFVVFTKCMNMKLKKCITGFSLWLEKGKFFLRPQFRLDRAYENYEIERNLYCLRNYNPSSLGSNPHGVRVKLRPKVNRTTGPGKIGARQIKPRFGTRANKNKLINRQHIGKSARSNTERNGRYKKHQISKQRPKVQRYSDQQGEGTSMQLKKEI